MRISVIIPCHGGIADTRICLEALGAQRTMDGTAWAEAAGNEPLDVVVVDNASPDGTANLAEEFRGVRVVRSDTNRGFPGGVNLGLRAIPPAPDILILVINNDTRAAPTMLARLQRSLLEHPNTAAVGPVSNFVKGSAQIDIGSAGATADGAASVERTLVQLADGKVDDVDNLSGLCLLAPSSVFAELGGFDERFGIGNFEDDDFSLRVRLRGRRLLVVRDAFLHHRGSTTFRQLGCDYQQVLREKRALFGHKWAHDPAGRVIEHSINKDVDRALDSAEAGLRRHPQWIDGWRWLAHLQHSRGDPAAARATLQRFVDRCPFHRESRFQLAQLDLICGDFLRAERRLASLLETQYLTTHAAVQLARAFATSCLAVGRADAARRVLHHALPLAPEDGAIFELAGSASYALDDLDRADQEFSRAVALGMDSARTDLGVVRFARGHRAEGLRLLHDAVTHAPESTRAQTNLAVALRSLRDEKSAS